MNIILDHIIERSKTSNNFEGKSILDNKNLLTLINLNFSHKEVAKKIGILPTTVRDWRRKNFPYTIYIKYFKIKKRFTEEENHLITLKKFPKGKSTKYCRKKMKDLGLDISDLKYSHSKHNLNNLKPNKNKYYSNYEIKEIINDNYNCKELACMFNRSKASIRSVKYRNRNKMVCN